jgi:hypothetical protein
MTSIYTLLYIYLNDAVLLALRVECILYVALSHNAKVTHHFECCLTQLEVLTVAQCLTRGYNDRVTC